MNVADGCVLLSIAAALLWLAWNTLRPYWRQEHESCVLRLKQQQLEVEAQARNREYLERYDSKQNAIRDLRDQLRAGDYGHVWDLANRKCALCGKTFLEELSDLPRRAICPDSSWALGVQDRLNRAMEDYALGSQPIVRKP